MTVLIDDDPTNANWITELQQAKGRPIPTPYPPTTDELARILEEYRADATITEEAMRQRLEELGYDPNQPRKSDGKWGRGGARGVGGTVAPTVEGNGGPGTPGIDPEALKASAAASKQFAWTASWAARREEVADREKAKAMKAIGADLDAKFPDDKLLAVVSTYEDAGFHPKGVTPGQMVADAMLESWSKDVAEPDGPHSMALQVAVQNEFKTGRPGYLVDQHAAMDPRQTAELKRFDQTVLRAGVRSMYDHTQARLDALKVGPTIGLTRGVGAKVRGAKPIDLNPASSWTVDIDTARTFSGLEGTIHLMSVPRTRILAMSGTGIGCLAESELVILRGKGDVSLGTAPESHK